MTLSRTTIDVMAQALEVSPDEIDGALVLGASAAWSSLSHMRLILLLEETLGRRLAPGEIVSVVSAPAVEALLSASRSNAASVAPSR